MRWITSHPTPALLLAHLQSSDSIALGVDFTMLKEVSDLTRTEQRMVFIQLSNPEGDTSYNMPCVVKFPDDVDLMANSQRIVDMVPILHTRFVNGKAVEDVEVSVQNLSRADLSEFQRLLYSPFDMSVGPLCRFGVDKTTNTLFLNIHHSIADGRSFQILFEAITDGKIKTSTRDWSIRKYAAYEALPEVIADQQESVKKYAEMLGDTPSRLDLDFAIPSVYHVSSIILDNDIRLALEAHCRKEKISLFAFALGAMKETVRAYSHESFAVGIAYDSRPARFRDSIGMFVNTVLIPFGKGNEGGKETLKQLNHRWTNSILPLALTPYDMVSAVGYGCNLFLAFNVGIIETKEGAPMMQQLPTYERMNDFEAPNAMFDLSISWEESGTDDGSIEISLESGIGPWPGLEDRFRQIITQMVSASSPSSSPLVIDSLLPQEEAQVLEWGTGAKDPIRDCCLHELVEKQVRIRPDAVALMNKCGTEKMTYGELDAKANRLAVELQKRGTKPNTFVGILMGGEKTFEMCVAVLGVMKSGAAYVPMDAILFPPERIKFIAEDTNMKLLVTVGEYADLVDGGFEKVIVEQIVEESCHDGVELQRYVMPTDCAYMIYTSGTTGTPKGVVCNHIGPVNMIFYDSGVEVFGKGTPGDDVVGCAAPLIFDAFVEGYFGALGSGLSLSLDMKYCTMLDCTPSVAELFLNDKTNNIKVMVVGGEACIQGLESKVTNFVNTYGPTEASIVCTGGEKSDTIGFPLPNTLIYVVHPDDGTLCPPGVSGELWIGGVGVGIGYHNRPELTAEKFIPNPYAKGRVYKTGDRVKWNEDGELVYLGRFDHQVKVRGYRIELGEIQAELEKQEGVKGALVVVYEDKLVAFVASGVDDPSQNDEFAKILMMALKSDSCSLTSYMIPTRILVMEEFPLTQNGKTDRKYLMSGLGNFFAGCLEETEYVAPATEEEAAMINRWQAVLGADRNIGMNDNFYHLGGHSILAMALAAVLECDVRWITSHPTPALLLAHLQSSDSIALGVDFTMLKEVSDLTRTEQRMVFIQLSNPEGDTSYNMPCVVKFPDDVDLMANSQRIVDMVPILHTRFVNGKAVEDVEVSVQNLSRADLSEFQRLLYSPFDMSVGPLCRFGVDKTTNTLFLNIHHSIADGRSFQILFEAITDGKIKTSTRDWSIRKYAAYEALPEVIADQQESVKKYAEMLGDTPSRLDLDFAIPSVYHVSSIILDNDIRLALEAHCRKEKISLFAFALGAMKETVRAYSHESFAVGIAYDSRPARFRDSIGMFVNTVLIPFGKGNEGGKETLKQLNHRWTNSILPLALTPYDMVSAVGYGCNLFLAFNVGIIETKEGAPMMQQLPTYERMNDFEAPNAMFDLSISWEESGTDDGSIEISLESGIGPWPGLEDRFRQIITQMVSASSPSSSPLVIDSLLPQEEAQVLEWGTGAKDPIRDCCLHELVEKQVRIRPDAVALMNKCGTEKMTYGELDAKANRLAVELQKRGTKPNTFVGILMGGEKTFEMCVAVLGVMKSGAAYVPMDAILFPPERIKFIAEDTNMKLLVTVGEYADLVDGGFEKVIVEQIVEESCHDGVELQRYVMPTDCAYMIYTSGTTGTPKGVVCNHIGPVNMIFYDSGVEVFGKGTPGDDVVGCAAPLIFDAFVEGYFGALGSGLSLSLDMKYCTMLDCTPSVAELFLNDKTNNIKVMVVGGEACIQGLESKVTNFVNTYGPTEASIVCTGGEKSDTIGFPLPNTLIYVVHPDDGTLCPPGVSGELWIGGVGVGIGYHNRPELTAEKFIPNPYAKGRVYKTGDRVKWNEDGELVYLGRFDHQVKVRGYRIELGEIQAELEKQEGVKGALVVVYEDKLVAFVASGVDDPSQNDEFAKILMMALKSDSCSLTSYMIPWKILVMEEFPLTQNGKTDRKFLIGQLQEGFHRASLVGSANVPESSTQRILCNLFEEILQVEAVGIDCDFMERGGYSLLIMKAATRIRDEFNIDQFSVRDFIELRTARNMAKKIDAILKDGNTAGNTAGHDDAFWSFSINSNAYSAFFRDDSLFLKLMTKVFAVIVLFGSCWAAILPSNILISKALHLELGAVRGGFQLGDFHLYLTVIGVLISVLLVFFVCLAVFSWFYGFLLLKVIGKGPFIIKQGTATFGLWYVFDRLWYVTRSLASGLFGGTAFHALFYKALGSSIGRNNYFEDADVRLPFMLTTGDNVVVEAGAKLETVVITKNGDVAVNNLIIGKDTVIGPNTHIGLGAKIGASCCILSLSLVQRGRNVADATIIGGHKTTKIDSTNEGARKELVDDQAVVSMGWHFAFYMLSFIPECMSILISVIEIYLGSNIPFGQTGTILALVFIFPIFQTFGQIVVAVCMRPVRRILLGGRAKPGWERVYSKSFLRRQLATSLYKSSLNALNSTVVGNLVIRFVFGADVDPKSSHIPHPEEPDLTRIGNCVFCANGVLLRNKLFYTGGIVRYGMIDIDDHSMILDRVVVAPDTTIKKRVMVAPITSVDADTSHEEGSVLIGNPALNLNRKTGYAEITSESLVSIFTYFFRA